MRDPGHVAVGTWSGGRFMHFGAELDDERLTRLLAPGDGIDTVLTADTYGAGDADRLLAAPEPAVLRGIEIRPVGPAVGNVRHDGPDLVAPVDPPPPDHAELTLF